MLLVWVRSGAELGVHFGTGDVSSVTRKELAAPWGRRGNGDGDEGCPEASFVTASKKHRTGCRSFQGFGFSGLGRSAGAQEHLSRLRRADVTLGAGLPSGASHGVGNQVPWAC